MVATPSAAVTSATSAASAASAGDEVPASDDDVSSYKLRGAHERCLESRPDRAIVLTPPRAPRATFRRVYSKPAHDALPSDRMLRLRFASPERLPDPAPRVVTHIGRNESTEAAVRYLTQSSSEPALRLSSSRACLQQSPPRIRMASAGARPRLVPRVVRHIDLSTEDVPVRAATLSARPPKRDVNKDPRRTQSSSVLLARDPPRNAGYSHLSELATDSIQHPAPHAKSPVVPLAPNPGRPKPPSPPPIPKRQELAARFDHCAPPLPQEEAHPNEEGCDSPKSPQFTMHRLRPALAPLVSNNLPPKPTEPVWTRKVEQSMGGDLMGKWALDMGLSNEENAAPPIGLDVVQPEPCRVAISETHKKPPKYGGRARMPKRMDVWKRVSRA